MAAKIVTVREAVVGVANNGAVQCIADASIVIDRGAIVAVGTSAEMRRRFPRFKVERYPQGTAFPGLVNGHHHIGVTTFQQGIADGPLESWIVRRIAQRAINPYLDTLYSAFEMIASGVTTVLHLYANRTTTAREMHDEARTSIAAYRKVGMRVSFAIMFFDQNPVGYCGDAFRNSLSKTEHAALGAWATGGDMDISEHLGVVDDLLNEFANDDGVRIQLAPGNVQWCSEKALEKLAEFSAARNIPAHIHFLETRMQRAYVDWRSRGRSPVTYLRSVGFAGSRTTVGHGVWLRRKDIDELCEHGFSVCHNCSSNLRLHSGIAPVRELIASGVNVALGLDEAAVNDDRDMLQEMRFAMHLHKVTANEDGSPPLEPGRLLHMATEGGAATTSFAGKIGAIAAGRAADFFVFDADAAAYPAPATFWTPLEMLLHRGRPDHVQATYVGGEKICAAGRFTRIDKGEVLAELAGKLAKTGRAPASERSILESIGRKLDATHAKAARTGDWYMRG